MDTAAVPGRLMRAWRWIIAPADETIADAARDGEILVARLRIGLVLLLLVIPIFALIMNPMEPEHWIGLGVVLIVLVGAVILDNAVRRGLYRTGLALITTLADVTIISLALVAFWVIGLPIVTTNSRVVFDAYFLAIAASALRYSRRICSVAGTAAVLQYLTISVLTWRFATDESMARAAGAYGSFDWSSQFGRLIMLVAATGLATAVVSRAVRLRRLSTSDPVTGLYNRAYMEEYLGHELVRSVRDGQPLVLAMLDVDHFKLFNDTYGHAAGDIALRELAQTIRSGLRRSDVVARFGGEELLIAMPATALPSAMEKLDELRVLVGLHDISLPRGGSARVTVSMGVAALELDGYTARELQDVADERLYAAKAAGRNRTFGPGDSAPAPAPTA